jgi:hypothetical protein
MVVNEVNVDGGITIVQGGKQPTMGLGSTNIVGSMYTTPEPPPEPASPPISPPASARTNQTLTSVVKPLKVQRSQLTDPMMTI